MAGAFPKGERRLESKLQRLSRRVADAPRERQDLDNRTVAVEEFCHIVPDGTGPLSHGGNNLLRRDPRGLYVSCGDVTSCIEFVPELSRFSLPGPVEESTSGVDLVRLDTKLRALHATLSDAGSTDTEVQAIVDGVDISPPIVIAAGDFGAVLEDLEVDIVAFSTRVQMRVNTAGAGATDLVVLVVYG